jgi:hypothetical protein
VLADPPMVSAAPSIPEVFAEPPMVSAAPSIPEVFAEPPMVGAASTAPETLSKPQIVRAFRHLVRRRAASLRLQLYPSRANSGVIESGGFPFAIIWVSLSSLIRLWEAGRWRGHTLRTCASG